MQHEYVPDAQGSGGNEGDYEPPAWGMIIFASLVAALLAIGWLLAWQRGGWMAWALGSVLLFYSLGLTHWVIGVAGRFVTGQGHRWRQPFARKYLTGFLAQAVAGFWLGAIGAPVVSLVALPLLSAGERLVDKWLWTPSPGFERPPVHKWVLWIVEGEVVGYVVGRIMHVVAL